MAEKSAQKAPQSAQDYLEQVKSNTPEVKWDKGEPQTLTPENIRRFVEGELSLAQIMGLSMDQAYAVAELGYNLFNQGKLNEALQIFEGLVVLNPYDGYFHGMVGAIYARKGEADKALEALTHAAGLEPKDPQVFVNRAEIYLNRGSFEEALDDLKVAIELDPDGNNPAVTRARALASATVQLIQEIVKSKGAKK